MEDKGDAVRWAVGIMIDITNLMERENELEALRRFSRVVAGTLNMEEIAKEVVATCVKDFGVKLAWVGKAEEDGSVSLVAQHPEDIDYPRQIKVRWDETPEGQGPVGKAIRSGKLQIVEDVLTYEGFAAFRERALKAGFVTVTAFPLVSLGKTFGTLVLYSDVRGFFNPHQIEFFQGFAYQAAGVLEKARFFLEASKHLSLIESLRAIDLTILGSLDLQLTLKVALEETKRQLGVEAVAVWIQDPLTRELELVYSITSPGEPLSILQT